MRRQPTEAERALWKVLQTLHPGVSFRRQHPIGPYVVDFVCVKAKLIIELDGSIHSTPEQKEYDKARTDFLQSAGFRVMRFFNRDVLDNVDRVLEDIQRNLKRQA